MSLPEVRDIELGRWYVCLIGNSEELCKVVRSLIPDPARVMVICYKVVCYYSGKELYSGKLNECRSWLRDRLQVVRKKG